MRSVLRMAMLCALAPAATHAAEELSIGAGGDMTWLGEVSGGRVEAITPEYRSLIDAQVTQLGVTPSGVLEFEAEDFPGSLLPGRLQEGENVAPGLIDRGGRITAPNVLHAGLEPILLSLITAEPQGLALQRDESNARGTLIDVDLGARFGVNLIRFFPRNTVFPAPTTPNQGMFLRNFEVKFNDGVDLTDAGNPIWQTYEIRTGNTDAVTTVSIEPPRYLRFVQLKATSTIPFEIEKIQVFGVGFVPSARYLSPIIDMRAPANWGALRWVQRQVGDPASAEMQIRTRTGSDPTPFVYTRRRVALRDAVEIPTSVANPGDPLGRDEFLDLPVKGGIGDTWERGSVRDDLVNWSPWSAPYDPAAATSSEGTRVRSPGPRRFFQMRVDFHSSDLESAIVLERLSYDFVSPPLADELVGEVYPREVEVAVDLPFVFAVQARMGTAGLQGFDGFEVTTTQPVKRVERIEILDADGQPVLNHTFTVQDAVTDEGVAAITAVTGQGFSVRFPRVVEDGTVVKIHFVGRVLAYSTTFTCRALLFAEQGFQQVIEGDAAVLGPGDSAQRSGVTVLSSAVTRGALIRNFEVDPVMTPNSDQANDRAGISYEVVAVVGQAGIRVEVLDLGGRRVRRLLDEAGENGLYDAGAFPELAWDGTDDSGRTVAPGIYLVRLEVAGDARSSTEMRTVGVAY